MSDHTTEREAPAVVRYRETAVPIAAPIALTGPDGELVPPALAYWCNMRGLAQLKAEYREGGPRPRAAIRRLSKHIEETLVWAMHDANLHELVAEYSGNDGAADD